MWSVVNFGKFAGKGFSLPQILTKDPDYFFWGVDEGVFKWALQREAEILARRATAIKIPKGDDIGDCIQYWLTPDGKFSGFAVIDQTQPAHVGSSTEIRRPVLNLEMPRKIKGYDKLGCRLMRKTFKYHWFGDKNFTRARVEDFFSDARNFKNP